MYITISGAIEVSIATMSKSDRCKTEEVYVCGFVPSYLLPNKRPNSLDPFLQPLIEDIEELFINGKLGVFLSHFMCCVILTESDYTLIIYLLL